MANPNEVIKKVEVLNRTVAELNAERQRKLGLLDASKKQFDEFVKNYEAIYGVKLTAENLSAEYAKVTKETEAAMEELEKQIEYIQSGAYKAEKKVEAPVQSVESVKAPTITNNNTGFVGFEQPVTPISQVATPQTVSKVTEDLPFDPDPPKPVVNTSPVATQTVSPVQSNVQSQLQSAGFPTFGAAPVVETTSTPVMSESQVNVEKPITPVGWGTPTPKPEGVNSTLGGMFGGKFGE